MQFNVYQKAAWEMQYKIATAQYKGKQVIREAFAQKIGIYLDEFDTEAEYNKQIDNALKVIGAQ